MRLPQTLPKLSIAAKLYAIFALMATTTVALSAVAVLNARHHAALTASFQASDSSGRAVERVRGLLYAVKLEARGIVMAGSRPIANERAEELGKIVDRINSAMSEWQLNVGTTDAAEFSRLSVQVGDLNGRLSDLVQKAQRAGPEAARAWAEQNHLAPAIEALSGTVKALGQRYVDRAVGETQPTRRPPPRARPDPTAPHQIGPHRAGRQPQRTRRGLGRITRPQPSPDLIFIRRRQPPIPTRHRNLLESRSVALTH